MSAPPAPAASGATPGEPGWRRPAVCIALLSAAVALAGFGWTLGGYFLGDDFGYVSRFHSFPLLQWPRLFVEGWAGDLWGVGLRELRPITALSYLLDARLWGGEAMGFRLTNLLLHTACTAMVGVIAWRAAGRSLACGLGAALLFGLHPAHAEPVQWITGRVDVLTTTLYLAGFLVFLRYRARGGAGWLAGFAGLYATTAFAKEFGLSLPLMALVADLLWLGTWRHWRRASTWLPYVVSALVAYAYFHCRRTAFGQHGTMGDWPSLTSAEFHRQFAERHLTYFAYLFPSLERWLQVGPSGTAVRTCLAAAGGALALIVGWRFGARHRPVEERRAAGYFGVGWYLVGTLPLVVTYVSARHLYLASAGLCVALAVIARGLVRPRWAYALVVGLVAGLFVQRLIPAMRPWHVAALQSGVIAREVRALESQIPPGGALLLDVPEIREGAYVWTWAVPFALRPPFVQGNMAARVVVFESRGLYVDWNGWHAQPAVAALRGIQEDGWVLQMHDDKPPRRTRVTAARLRTAAGHFNAEIAREHPHEEWRKLINELTAD